MVAELKQCFARKYGANEGENPALEFDLIPGAHGIFDVASEGEVVYSKYKTSRFPEEGELSRIIFDG